MPEDAPVTTTTRRLLTRTTIARRFCYGPLVLPHVLALSADALVAHAAAHEVPLRIEQARRILVDAWAPPGAPVRRQTVAAKLRERVGAILRHDAVTVVERAADPVDGFVKYLLRTHDGAEFEAVRIPLHRAGRFSICLSSQVGCAMRCDFCATGRLGLSRNLSAWEILSSFKVVRDEAPGRVTGAVFQGQGEPLHNYEHVIAAAGRLRDPCGAAISGDAITISTVGLVPQIRRFTAERLPYRLIVSLTTTDLPRRERLLPVASRFALPELVDALREYQRSKGGKITVAWVLMGGVNGGLDEVERIRELFADIPVIVNLIDVNDARAEGYRRADDDERGRFLDGLSAAGIPFIRRYSGGAGRHAACGMLAATRFAEAPEAS
jgi:23S rRNA (adenine2503-C2)-methyltransferase